MLQEIINVSDEHSEIEINALSKMTITDKAKYEGFFGVSKKLESHLGVIFEVDHVTSIKDGHELAITHTNLQILVQGIKRRKKNLTEERLGFNAQCSHIIDCAKIIPGADFQYINLIIKELNLYWN